MGYPSSFRPTGPCQRLNWHLPHCTMHKPTKRAVALTSGNKKSVRLDIFAVLEAAYIQLHIVLGAQVRLERRSEVIQVWPQSGVSIKGSIE